MDPLPRICKLTAPPGKPLSVLISTPVIRPERAETKFVIGCLSITSDFTEDIEPVLSVFVT
ncbi:hypothetical protein D3C85_1515680 [compost metagenome]